MIFSQGFKVKFRAGDREFKCQVDKMRILGHRPEVFYRVGSHKGNRDLICHEGQWIVCSGPHLENNILDALGKAIESAMEIDI